MHAITFERGINTPTGDTPPDICDDSLSTMAHLTFSTKVKENYYTRSWKAVKNFFNNLVSKVIALFHKIMGKPTPPPPENKIQTPPCSDHTHTISKPISLAVPPPPKDTTPTSANHAPIASKPIPPAIPTPPVNKIPTSANHAPIASKPIPPAIPTPPVNKIPTPTNYVPIASKPTPQTIPTPPVDKIPTSTNYAPIASKPTPQTIPTPPKDTTPTPTNHPQRGVMISSKDNNQTAPIVRSNRPTGLRQIGNSCYIASTLQSLLASETFCRRISQDVTKKKGETDQHFTERQHVQRALKALVSSMKTPASNQNKVQDLFYEFRRVVFENKTLHPELSLYGEYKVVGKKAYFYKSSTQEQKNLHQLIQGKLTKKQQVYDTGARIEYSYEDVKEVLKELKISETDQRLKGILLLEDHRVYQADKKKHTSPLSMQNDAAELTMLLMEVLDFHIDHQEVWQGEGGISSSGRIEAQAMVDISGISKGSTLQKLVEQRFGLRDADPDQEIEVEVDGDIKRVKKVKEQCRITNDPEFLALRLKRFEYDLIKDCAIKVSDPVALPNNFELDFSSAFDSTGEHKYKIVSIVKHAGKTPKGGHYIANTLYNDRWYNYNDGTISNTDSTGTKDNQGFQNVIFILEKV